MGGQRVANCKIDFASKLMFVSFLKSKSDVVEDNVTFLKFIRKRHGMKLKFIRMDNSGENKRSARMISKIDPSIVFEFTAKNTPQQNGLIERNMATIW